MGTIIIIIIFNKKCLEIIKNNNYFKLKGKGMLLGSKPGGTTVFYFILEFVKLW